MTSKNNNNDNAVIQQNLTFWCRWKALYYKGNKSFSASLEEESAYIKTLPDYVRSWIVDGKGTEIAKIDNDVIHAAIVWMIADEGKQKTINTIKQSIEDFRYLIEYCYKELECD